MKKSLLVALIFSVAACGIFPDERDGAAQHEQGVITNTNFMPSVTSSGTGMTSNGHMVFVSTTSDAQYGVIIKCQHGQFAQRLRKETWEKFAVGDTVDITYHEVWAVYSDSTKNKFVGYKTTDVTKHNGSF